ncbi:MAG TPA: ISNCY family transposase [Candidatus Limnocylindrales bacterium]
METTITMTAREQRRARVLTRILSGELTMAEGGLQLGLSERQLWRLRSAFVEAGPAGLVHGNRGRPSSRRIDPDRRARIIELRERYGPLNDSHFDELLAEREGIIISRESVRAILRAEGIASPRRRRSPRYRSRRPRMGAEGTLLQLDGSRHRWLEARGPELVLVGAIDDATGLVTAAVFRDQEDAAGYLEILFATIEVYGLPGAIYRDGHSAFAPSSPARHHPLADDDPALSQVGRALVELDIDSILAGSAQAKGRIERLWGTFQDRLVVELRLAGVVDRAGANAFLVHYLPRHNARFVVPAADPVPAWRTLPDDVRLERVLVFKYRRKVARDHTISLAGRILQLPRGATGRANYAGKRVEVHVALDGSIVAYDGERRLAVLAAPPDPVQLRTERRQRVLPSLSPAAATIPWTPPRDHPWKRPTPGSKLEKRLTESLGS